MILIKFRKRKAPLIFGGGFVVVQKIYIIGYLSKYSMPIFDFDLVEELKGNIFNA